METFIFWQSNGIRAKKHTHHIQNNIINNNNNINKKWLQFLSRAKRTMSNGKIYGCNSSLRVCLFVCIMFFLLLGCAWAYACICAENQIIFLPHLFNSQCVYVRDVFQCAWIFSTSSYAHQFSFYFSSCFFFYFILF